MEAKHTPGPWRVDPSANCDVQTADGQFEIATTHPEILRGGRTDADCAQANARLISAAPEMLAALEAAGRAFNTISASNGATREAEAAIAAAITKAKGA
jgi:hypothetical protein